MTDLRHPIGQFAYAWHGDHHPAHITWLCARVRWDVPQPAAG